MILPAITCCYKRVTVFILICMFSPPTKAQWLAHVGSNLHYTDDVALFSVTRRLSLKDDPTQPMVDRPNQGGDFIYDPRVELEWSKANGLGDFQLSMIASGYIFLDQSAYTHGLYELQVTQSFETGKKISLYYNLVPELYLGKNKIKSLTGEESEHNEQLTNQYWAIHLDQSLSDHFLIRFLGRYGLRKYNAPFQHRNSQFWTVGTHLESFITPDIEFLLGYHYEQGTVNHNRAAYFADDISYINHYVSAELRLHLADRLTAAFIIDYEKNMFTSDIRQDEHYGADESVYQGEIELLYAINTAVSLKLGWQYGKRKLSSEAFSVKNNNAWLGFEYGF